MKIEQLRAEYEQIASIDPSKPAYKKLDRFLNAQTDDVLKDLYAAKIKWVSSMAYTRLFRRGVQV